jgi:hypothetical protein
MTTVASGLVDWSALGQVALISACAGVGIGFALVLATLSSLRAEAERADGNVVAALILSAVGVICVLIVVSAIAAGLYIITAK